MTDRITEARLQRAVDALNEAFGYPIAPYAEGHDAAGNRRFIPQARNIHVAGAYGGWRLEQMDPNGGSGTRDVGGGFGPRRQVYDQVQAMLWAVREMKETRK